MALHTSNIYGDITIADDAVAMIVAKIAKEIPGVAELVSRRLSDNVLMLFGKEPLAKGVKLVTMDNRIFIELFILVTDGINVEAVVESLKSSITYHVESFTGMRVKSVEVNVLGLKL